MMRRVFSILMCLHQTIAQYEGADVTLAVRDRVEVLKRQIYDEIEKDQEDIVAKELAEKNLGWLRHQKSIELDDNYEYKDSDGQPITPIMNSDERKFKDRYKHKPLYTKHPTTFVASEEEFNVSPVEAKRARPKRKKKRAPVKVNKAKDIFYRRYGLDLNKPIRSIHHHDLLTPFLTSGLPFNTTEKIVLATDSKVLRLISLLAENKREATKDEIYSVLYQISNIPIRIFQWSSEALKLLYSQITQEERHNFRTLKRGVKRIFANWHLDIGNTTNLLQQTRIFRPPCTTTSELSGSTKKPRGARFTKSKPTKKTCPDEVASADNTCEY